MCGIAVAIGWNEAAATVEKLIAGITHRGDVTDPMATPAPGIALCTRRLRIVDAAHAVQPQASCDGRFLVSLNGEIYNHAALRDTLEAAGLKHRTSSDTEVLANALRLWGYRALEKLSGMYAFVAVDLKTGEFLAARDPFGIKPLYVVQRETGFLFCSEIRPLLQATQTDDVLLLPPGHLLTKERCVRFPSMVHPAGEERIAFDAKALDGLLADAVTRHLPPDLPCAMLFSGGIDSTLVADYVRRAGHSCPGYFVGDHNSVDYPFAAAYAEVNGMDMRTIPFDGASDSAFAGIADAVATAESFEPNLIRGAICSMVAAEAMHRDGFRVALCGEGADELFCGYAPLEHSFAVGEAEGRAVRAQCLDMMHKISLQRVDRCSMRHQVETRVPFLDPELANYGLRLGPDALVRRDGSRMVGKAALRALYDLHPANLPRLIRDRDKVLFSEGTGMTNDPLSSAWSQRFDTQISASEFADGQRQYAPFSLKSKEELHYLRILAQDMDVFRVPHLRDRAWIALPEAAHAKLSA